MGLGLLQFGKSRNLPRVGGLTWTPALFFLSSEAWASVFFKCLCMGLLAVRIHSAEQAGKGPWAKPYVYPSRV